MKMKTNPTNTVVTRVLVLLLLSAHAGPSFALDCNKRLTTVELNECASKEKDKVEAKLNSTYQRIMKSLSRPDPDTDSEQRSRMKKSLISAQRAWVTFREADCDAVYEKHADGTIRNLMYISCLQRHAEKRVKDLESFERD
ncbi:lysozyme inhibitor LprI family protein [Massilia niabensis]|uniref:Lysozyme inhibitor LprI family protein n=1 Tax=Massilia niabensis TaxID=544910 RepID=A0ABW0KYI5_9BURK